MKQHEFNYLEKEFAELLGDLMRNKEIDAKVFTKIQIRLKAAIITLQHNNEEKEPESLEDVTKTQLGHILTEAHEAMIRMTEDLHIEAHNNEILYSGISRGVKVLLDKQTAINKTKEK